MTSPGLRRSLAAIALIIALLVGPAAVATADSTNSGSAVALVGQTDWNVGTNPFDLRVRVTGNGPVDQTELVVTVFNQVHNRSQYQQSLQDHISGSSIILERHTLGEVLQPDGTAAVSLPIQDAAQKRYYLKDAGIYPVRVELRTLGSSTSTSRFVTHLIIEPPAAAPAQTLGVTTVLPVQTAQSIDSKTPLTAPDAGRPFETVSKTLAAHPAMPVTLLAEPESIERLSTADSSNATKPLADFKTSVGTRPVARTSWAPLPAALYNAETFGEVNEQMNRGASILNASFEHIDNSDWVVTDQADTASLNDAKNRGFSRVILPEASLSPTSRATTLARPFNVSLGKSAKQSITTGMADQALSDHFFDPAGPILGAHRLLADLAVVWNDLPGQQRSVIVMPPRNWNPDPGFLETLFRGLENSPVLKAQSTDDYFATPAEKTGSTILSRTLAPLAKAQTTISSGRINDTRKLVDGFGNLVDTDNRMLAQYQQRILLAERAELDDRSRSTSLDSIRSNIDHELSLIQLPPERSIRLTARTGDIPISVQNDTGYVVHVKVELTSNKLLFPSGNSRTIDLSRQHVTEGFTIDARTSGAFPLQVRLLSPDGLTVVERSSITIRSTATSAIGVGLSIGAGVFLFIWWIRSSIKLRHKKRLAAA